MADGNAAPTATRPLVVGYVSPDAPAGYRAAARLLIPTLSDLKKDRGKIEPHPVIFHGDDVDEVCAQALAWWDGELARAVAKAAARISAAEKARATRAAKADTSPQKPSDGSSLQSEDLSI